MSGVFFDFLAPSGPWFWVVLIVGGFFTFGPIIGTWYDSPKDQKSAVTTGVISGVITLTLLHLFGDNRIFSWLYTYPSEVKTSMSLWETLSQPFGILFWVIALGGLGVMLVNLRCKSGAWAVFSLFLTLGLLQFVTNVPVFPWIWHHPTQAGIYFGLYLLIGLGWFFYKWDDYVKFHRQSYDELKSEWLEKKGLSKDSDLTLQDRSEWETYFKDYNVASHYEDKVKIEFRPRFRDHKSELTGWLVTWPVSLIETLLFDFFAGLARQSIFYLSGLLDRITKYRWKGTENDMLSEAEKIELAKMQAKKDSGGKL